MYIYHYMYIYTNTYIYIYIYIYTRVEDSSNSPIALRSDVGREGRKMDFFSIFIDAWIDRYIPMHVDIYMFICICEFAGSSNSPIALRSAVK